LGNLIPILVWLPITAIGAWFFLRPQPSVEIGIGLVVTGQILTWLAVNQFGLWQNQAMKLAMDQRLSQRTSTPVGERHFVGIATPSHRGLLDAHEDIGYLYILEDRLEYVGEKRTLTIPKQQVLQLRFRFNVHSLLGLGRWISIEGVCDGVRYRLNFEPRERNTLLGNRRYSRALLNRLTQWRKA
jgi:hypothetical protein